MRAVGYIERARESLVIVLEPSEDSVMQLVKDNKLNAEFTVRLTTSTVLLFFCTDAHSAQPFAMFVYCVCVDTAAASGLWRKVLLCSATERVTCAVYIVHRVW